VFYVRDSGFFFVFFKKKKTENGGLVFFFFFCFFFFPSKTFSLNGAKIYIYINYPLSVKTKKGFKKCAQIYNFKKKIIFFTLP